MQRQNSLPGGDSHLCRFGGERAFINYPYILLILYLFKCLFFPITVGIYFLLLSGSNDTHLSFFNALTNRYSLWKRLISEENPGGAITEAACWAHIRRKFYEVTIANDKANIAISVMEEISRIYQIEEEIKGLEPEKRLEHRQ